MINQKLVTNNLPIFRIEKILSKLQKNDIIFSREMAARGENEQIVTMRERSGLVIEDYINKPLECVTEITQARFFTQAPENQHPPKSVIKGTFESWQTGYKFFDELVYMVDREMDDDEDFDENEYDILANKLFPEWGISGFGLDIYQDKPMIKTDLGTFFLNEYIFADLIEDWQYGQELYFIPEELLLWGIKIAVPKPHQNSPKQFVVKPPSPNVYNTYKGKKYTEAEWKIKEQELWEEYAKKHNLPLGNKDEKKGKDNSPPSRFLLD